MFKPLDRSVAIVVVESEILASGAILERLTTEFLATSRLFSVAQLTLLNATEFDAVVLSEFDLADLPVIETKSLAKTLKLFHAQSKPIGAIGKSVRLVAGLFAASNVEVTGGESEVSDPTSVAAEIRALGATHTPCPASDYISDRDNKTLTTPGSLALSSHAAVNGPATAADGIRKMLQELIEMA